MPIFFGTIKDGELKLHDENSFKIFLAKVKDFPSVILKLEKRRRIRSLRANAYYWSYVLGEIEKESGQDKEELHEAFKKKFLPKRFIKVGKEELEAEPTTTKLDNYEFSQFVEKVKLLGTEFLNIVWLSEDDYNSLEI